MDDTIYKTHAAIYFLCGAAVFSLVSTIFTWFVATNHYNTQVEALSNSVKQVVSSCPTFNYLPRHLRIGAYHISASKAHFLGAPAEYEQYLINHNFWINES